MHSLYSPSITTASPRPPASPISRPTAPPLTASPDSAVAASAFRTSEDAKPASRTCCTSAVMASPAAQLAPGSSHVFAGTASPAAKADPGASRPPSSSSPRSADDVDSDGPQSPEFAPPDFAHSDPMDTTPSSPDPDRVLRAWSPGSNARAATRRNTGVLAPAGMSPAKLKRQRVEADRRSIDSAAAAAAAAKENDPSLYDSDSDGDDGYARGTVFASDEEDNADEDDDLFITPRRSDSPRARYAQSAGSGPAHGEGYVNFDPIHALLDDHWHAFRLDDDDASDGADGGGFASEEDLPVHLAPIAQHLRALVVESTEEGGTPGREMSSSRWRRELAEVERQLMEALRDADEVEASRERYARECDVYKGQVAAREAKVLRLVRENEAAAREIAAVTEAMATLTAAHDVDARINDLLIADQAEEIRELRRKLEVERCRSQASSENGSEIASRSTTPTASRSGSPIASPNDSIGSIGKTGPRLEQAFKQAAAEVSMRASRIPQRHASPPGRRKTGTRGSGTAHSTRQRGSEIRAKEREVLIRRKESMFKEYEKRHSMTIQHVVRRTSQLSLASRNNSRLLADGAVEKEDGDVSP